MSSACFVAAVRSAWPSSGWASLAVSSRIPAKPRARAQSIWPAVTGVAVGVYLVRFNGVGTPAGTWNSIVCGLLLIVLAIPRGKVRERYAGWDRYIV